MLSRDEQLTDEGRALKRRIETRTDELAAEAYESLSGSELGTLVADLTPLAGRMKEAGSR